MRKKSSSGLGKADVDLEIPPMTRAEMRRGVMGKYAKQNYRFIALDHDVAQLFPTSEVVNKALRLVAQLKQIGTRRKKSA